VHIDTDTRPVVSFISFTGLCSRCDLSVSLTTIHTQTHKHTQTPSALCFPPSLLQHSQLNVKLYCKPHTHTIYNCESCDGVVDSYLRNLSCRWSDECWFCWKPLSASVRVRQPRSPSPSPTSLVHRSEGLYFYVDLWTLTYIFIHFLYTSYPISFWCFAFSSSLLCLTLLSSVPSVQNKDAEQKMCV